MKKAIAIVAALLAVLSLSVAVALAADEYEEGGATQAIGGHLITTDGRLEYRVQADSYWFSDETRMRYFKPGESNLPARPEGTVWVGEPFRLELREWPELTMLSWRKPATMTIHYDPAELGGRDESWLRIVRYFDSWVEVPMTQDTTNHTVTTEIPWGGDYGVIAYDSEPPTPAPAPTVPEDPRTAVLAAASATASSAVSGRIFYDKNANGVMDGDDYPVQGAGVRIGNEEYNALTSTGADGYYHFSGIPAGVYTLDPVVGAQWDFTTPKSVAGISVSGDSGSTGSADFGLIYKSWYSSL